jgi:two-component system response regulator AtoC
MDKNNSKKEKIPILIIDDDESICRYLIDLLSIRGYRPEAVHNGESAIELISKGNAYSVVLLDIMLPGLNGLEVLKRIKEINQTLPVIMLSILGDAENVVTAIKEGAYDYIVKPFDSEKLEVIIQNAVEKHNLIEEVRYLKQQLSRVKEGGKQFLFINEKMAKINDIIRHITNTDVTVMILGESGVGKEVIANEIHRQSERREKPFIKIHCASLPETLLESELFGYEKGAFTGAYKRKPGKFELANHGTIFLDEIGDISLSLQAKLLQVLQDGHFSHLGGKDDIHVDVRIIVATNRDLEKAVKDGQFREDLYYRLNVVRILVPPLRERRDEIPMFVNHFMKVYSIKHQKKPRNISKELMDLLMLYEFPGNVRELENMIQRLVVLGEEGTIIQELRSSIKRIKFSNDKMKAENISQKIIPLKIAKKNAFQQIEREAIISALINTNWNRKKAAQLLKVSYKTLLYKIKSLGISKDVDFIKKN